MVGDPRAIQAEHAAYDYRELRRIHSGFNASTARDIITQLRYLQFLDAEGRPTDIAEDWRHDDTYAKACAAIRAAVYPEELLHTAPSPSEDRAAAERWFARKKKVGANAALKMAITYQLVTEADLSKAPDTNKAAAKGKAGDRPRSAVKQQLGTTKQQASSDIQVHPPKQPDRKVDEGGGKSAPQTTPSLHIDIQIHIASDASAAQIDQIFASMAKHLYSRSVTT